ncbi:MAG: hypothetical protein LBQ64_03925 [Bacteroidales bacterium]|jgi:hypothetical protein|nr:hypothetical protein [Bacteroidales bacterium]
MTIPVFVYAQAPYKQGIGIVTGFMHGASYKTFILGDKLALQADLSVKANIRRGTFWSLDMLAPNIMYQQEISNLRLYWFAGGGFSLGYAFTGLKDYGKFGLNAMGGVEYKFKFPLTVQADFRPGYGLLFRKQFSDSYFDFSLNVSARYTF